MKMFAYSNKQELVRYHSDKDQAEDIPIPSGDYILLQYVPKVESAELKNYLPLIPAGVRKDGKLDFIWAVPDEPYVRLYLKLPLKPPKKLVKLSFKDLGNLPQETVRELWAWQKTEIIKLGRAFKSGDRYSQAIIAGLGGGKTLLNLVLCQLDPENALYVCPKHLSGEVERECIKWGLQIPQISTFEGTKKLLGQNFSVIICDEAILCKNPDAQRTNAILELTSNADVVIACTGSPLSAKKGKDARWTRLAGKYISSSEDCLDMTYGVNPRREAIAGVDLGTRINGEEKKILRVDGYDVKKMARDLSQVLTAVDISSLISKVPEMREERIYIKSPKFFSMVLKGLLTTRTKSKATNQARTCTSGFYYDDEDKIKYLKDAQGKVEWLVNFCKTSPEEKVVCYSNYEPERVKIREILTEKGVQNVDIRGIDSFLTKDDVNVLVLGYGQAEGLNLQCARIQVFFSYNPSPQKLTQALGRCHRHGQTRQVFVFHLLCENTLDDKTLDILKNHQADSEALVDELINQELERLARS